MVIIDGLFDDDAAHVTGARLLTQSRVKVQGTLGQGRVAQFHEPLVQGRLLVRLQEGRAKAQLPGLRIRNCFLRILLELRGSSTLAKKINFSFLYV